MSLLGFLRRGRKREAEVAVVGSGLPALLVAWELARRSRRVVVIGVEEQASPGGLGLAVLGPARPYTHAADVLGVDGARAVWSAGRENLERFRGFLREARQDCGYEPRGSFLLASDREEAEALAASEDPLRDDGFPGEFLDHYMLETHFDLSGFAGAYWAADGGDLDAVRLGTTAAAAAHAAGAVFRRVSVRGLTAGRSGVVVETEEGPIQAASAVLATDTVASALWLDPRPRLLPTAAGRLRLTAEEGAVLPATARTADGRLAWQVGGDGLTLVATSREPSTEGAGDPAGLEGLAGRLPARVARRWRERGEAPSDGLPVVGTLAGVPLAVACGFGPLAASFTFAAAGWIADALLDGNDPTPGPLRAGRAPAAGLV